MVGFKCHILDETHRVVEGQERAAGKALAKVAFEIRKAAIASIVESPEPSRPGRPPHTRRGLARRAIMYSVDRKAQRAVIGPEASIIGDAMRAHEFGGDFRGQTYPQRPFMGPALERNVGLLPTGFAGEVHS